MAISCVNRSRRRQAPAIASRLPDTLMGLLTGKMGAITRLTKVVEGRRANHACPSILAVELRGVAVAA